MTITIAMTLFYIKGIGDAGQEKHLLLCHSEIAYIALVYSPSTYAYKIGFFISCFIAIVYGIKWA